MCDPGTMCSGGTCGATCQASQADWPAEHETAQVPPEQTVPAAQTRPQVPQLLLSVWRSRHTPEQLVVPAEHDTAHTPAEQTVPAPHARPQAPQLLLSLVRSRHTPEQLVVPVAHVTLHVPAEHT